MNITTVRDLRFIAPRILDPRDYMTSYPRFQIFRTHSDTGTRTMCILCTPVIMECG